MPEPASYKAVIPLRSGSKSIPDKNIKLFCGKPLFYWAGQAALDSDVFDGGVFFAVDSERYADEIRTWLPDATVLHRPPNTATDTASTESVLLWFAGVESFDVLCLIQATSPTVRADDFVRARRQFEESSSDSLVTGVRFQRFVWTGDGRAVNYDPRQRPRRQEMLPHYVENGAFYFTKRAVLETDRCRLGGRVCVFPMDAATEVEIDEPADWPAAETAFRSLNRDVSKRPSVLVVDVDGTLTDGGMYYGNDGEAMKKFNTRDGAALQEFQRLGFEVVVCTGESAPSVARRVEKLGIGNYIPGAKDKVEVLSSWLAAKSLTWNEVLYVGDEINDLPAMKKSAVRVCPGDAHTEVQAEADYVSPVLGGAGVLRDTLAYVLERWPRAGTV